MSEPKKTITLWKGVALAVCTVIGSGLLGLPGLTLEIGSVHSAAAGWLLISVAMIPLIAVFSRLGLRFTSSAGLSKYAEEALGPWGRHAVAAVLCGTFMIGIPSMAWIGGAYVQNLVGFPPGAICGLAVIILILATAINLMGVRAVNLINTASLIALAAMMVFIVVTHSAFFGKGMLVFWEVACAKSEVDFGDMWRIAGLLFWAFVGWENLSFSLEEFERPETNIPRVYWLSFLVVVCLYFGLTVTSIGADASGVSVRGASGLTVLLADSPFGIFPLLILILVIPANLNAWIFGANRLYFSSGQAGILPPFWGRLTARGLPLNSLLGSLAVYIADTVAAHYHGVRLATLVRLVNQNGLVLYAFSIFAYWKTERGGVRRWLVTALALVSCCFLLAGFSWRIVFSLGLVAIGYWNCSRLERQTRAKNGFETKGRGIMDNKMKELIAIGASVSTHCQPCVTYHVEKALGLGVEIELILEAVSVAQMVEKGAGSAMREFTQELLGKRAADLGCCPETGRFETPAGDARCHCG